MRQGALFFLVIAVLIGGGIFLITAADDDEDANEFDPSLATTTESTEAQQIDDDTTTSSTASLEPVELSPPPLGATIEGPTPCPAEDGTAERTTQFAEAPPLCIDPEATYTAVITTTKGDITIELDPGRAPQTVNNFVVLSRYRYYEGVPFHRIIPGFVIQGGDAVGPDLGIGGPGYAIDDELPEEGDYEIGSVAMANSGPDTNGSQFFIVTGEAGVGLRPDFSLFGQVTGGLDVVAELDAIGTEGSGRPLETVTIDSVTITEG